MTRKLILLTILLISACWSQRVSGQELVGPEKTIPGTLAMFEITPPQIADWTITSVEKTEHVFKPDTSTNRLYFATPIPGTYHIVAAIIVDGKPQLLTKTLINGNDDKIEPHPAPVPKPPVPPLPEPTLVTWIQTQLPLLVKSGNLSSERIQVGKCFEQVAQKIESGTIKTAQNARAQLQIALTGALAMASNTAMDDWHEFLTQLSRQMETELGKNINNVDAVKNVFKTVADAMNEASGFKPQPSEKPKKESNQTSLRGQHQFKPRWLQQFR
ncbi:MAG: hypothetical protein FWC50_09715 [Planctomycetaceae bacterium]|nr:hypothetical protein [Planctomycetaceae bacterium]